MEDNNHLIQKDLLKTLNNFDCQSKVMPPVNIGIESKLKSKDDYLKEYKEHLNDIRVFVDSFNSCSVSPEIIGEWNIIQKDINDYLFNSNISFGGACPKLKEFYLRELEHLNSIKNKLGDNAIEYQMICSLVAEAVILDIESSMILVNVIGGQTDRNDYIGKQINNQIYQNMIKDCLNALENIASLNMEYQYKYERFTPFYKSTSEKGERIGLIKKEEKSSNSGCFSLIALVIVSTLLCSFLLIR